MDYLLSQDKGGVVKDRGRFDTLLRNSEFPIIQNFGEGSQPGKERYRYSKHQHPVENAMDDKEDSESRRRPMQPRDPQA